MHTAPESQDYRRVRQAVLLGLFGGTGIGLGYLLAGVPGVELMSTNAALAGLALGTGGGAVVGGVAVLVYSLGSPFGPPVPTVLIAQVVGMALAGAAGGLLAPTLRSAPRLVASVLAACAGLLAAVVLDLVTNLAVAKTFAMPWQGVLVAGLPLAALHAGVVAVAWGTLLPVLSLRLGRLRGGGPRRIRGVVPLLLMAVTWTGDATAQNVAPPDSVLMAAGVTALDSLTTTVPAIGDTLQPASAPADSTVPTTAPPDTVDSRSRFPTGWPEQWDRPCWEPFHGGFREQLERTTDWLPVVDGGQGAAVVILGEPGTSFAPTILRDGIPLGTGNRYLDDPEAISVAGRDVVSRRSGLGPFGSLGSMVVLERHDPTPDRDVVDTRWFKGRHESFLRDVQILTADASWRLGFDFQEIIDIEAYDFRTPGEIRYPELDVDVLEDFWGHTKFRSGRGMLQRTLDDAGRVTLNIENTRKLKKGLPAYGLDHHDLWRNDVDLGWRAADPADPTSVVVWWSDAHNTLDPEDGPTRSLESSRSGVRGVWGCRRERGELAMAYDRWTLLDTGADSDWAPDDDGPVQMRGEDMSALLSRDTSVAGVGVAATVGGWRSQASGWKFGGSLALTTERVGSRWKLGLEHAGRAPRSDELATPWRFTVPSGQHTVVLPNPDLGHENEWRLSAAWAHRLLGTDLDLEVSRRRLRHGIGWEPSAADPRSGRWDNGVSLDATSLHGALSREGMLLGWYRLNASVSWHDWQRGDHLRLALPPLLHYRVSAVWEHHYFAEDGILQLAGYLYNRGAMCDPWYLAGDYDLPALTRFDAIVGFRLVGTNLSLEFGNILGHEARVSAGAMSSPFDVRWRLHWVFHY